MMAPMSDVAPASADQKLDEIALPRAILFDLDDTILAAGQRLEVLRLIAGEFESEFAPCGPITWPSSWMQRSRSSGRIRRVTGLRVSAYPKLASR